jgi:hypothetical protein
VLVYRLWRRRYLYVGGNQRAGCKKTDGKTVPFLESLINAVVALRRSRTERRIIYSDYPLHLILNR